MEQYKHDEPTSRSSSDAKSADRQTAQSSNRPKNNKPLIATSIICVVLAVAGIAFGIYGMFLKPQPADQSSQASSSTEPNDQNASADGDTSSSGNTSDATSISPVSPQEAEKLLADKYNFKESQIVMYDGWHNYLEDFNQPNKILFTIYQIRDSLGAPQLVESDRPLVKSTIGFEDFKKIYEDYFGKDEPLERKDYDLNGVYEKLVYNEDGDSFDIYSKTGLGGYSTITLKSKVIKAEGIENGFKALVLTVTLNEIASQNAKDFFGKSLDGQGNEYYNVPISEDELAKIRESLSAYEFTFKNQDDGYKLTSITKIQ